MPSGTLLCPDEISLPPAPSPPSSATLHITAVIPAYNEEDRILGVVNILKRLKQTNEVDEVIVVSDGSTDRTFEKASKVSGVEAMQLPRNMGKAAAMYMGALCARSEWLLFLDADLIGLRPQHIRKLLQPIRNREAEMSVGIFNGGRFLTDLSQYIAPSITGQRVVPRNFFLSLPDIGDLRFGVEMAIGFHARKQGLRVSSICMEGVTHPMKEEKLGPLRGSAARMRMYYEIGRYCLYSSRHR